jgi:hypothetical protein
MLFGINDHDVVMMLLIDSDAVDRCRCCRSDEILLMCSTMLLCRSILSMSTM